MKYLLYSLLFIQFISAQNVSIKLKFENTSDSIPIVASKSINDDAAYFLMNTDTIYTKDNKAELKFKAINAGYLNFSFSKANPAIYILYEPKDVIELTVSKSQDNKYSVQYAGKNSDVLLAINVDTVYKYQKFAHKFRKVIFEAKKGSDILNFIKNKHKIALQKLQDLYDANKISKDFYAVAKLNLANTVAYNSKSIIEDIFRIDEEFVNAKLSKPEFLQLLNDLMTEFNPFDEQFKDFTSITTFDNWQAKSKFMSEIDSDAIRTEKNLWKNKNSRQYYNFIPLQYQERLFAHLFVNDRLNESDLQQFKTVFPKSLYIPYLYNYLRNKKTTMYKPLSFGYFINNQFEYLRQVNNPDINSIVADNFAGKAVFVDLWASYCAPCFQEFAHSQKLFAFLKANNIEMLYINIDNDKDIAKWQPNIKRNYLEGNHIFASDKIQESLQKLLNEPKGVFIPRYLLFDAKGKLVLPNTKKPSEGQVLYDDILNALK